MFQNEIIKACHKFGRPFIFEKNIIKEVNIMALEKIARFEELKQLLQEKETLFLLKNSTTCPISHEAFRQYEKFADEQVEPSYYLNVQEAKIFSNEIAETFSVKHESPQILLFKNGSITWHTSHWNITYKNLKEQLKV